MRKRIKTILKNIKSQQSVMDILYVTAAVVLCLLLILMYTNYRSRKAAYSQMVQEAIQEEKLVELQPRDDIRDVDEDEEAGLGELLNSFTEYC